MPYRSSAPVRVYSLRSSRLMIGVTGFVALLGGLLFLAALFSGRELDLRAWLLALVPTVAAFAYMASIKHELVSGGAGEVRLFAGHLEVPRSFAGPPLALPLDELELTIQRFEGRIMFTTVSAVEVLHLRAQGHKRGLSSRIFESPEQLRRLAEDLLALQAGQPVPSRDRSGAVDGPPAPDAPDAYDERLDDELERLD